MIISERVKHFVEDNIEMIEDEDSFMLLTTAFEELDNSECYELIRTLEEVNYPKLKEARESVMRYLMMHALEGYLDYPDEHDTISVQRFQSHYLTNRLGYSWDEFIQFLFDNEDEWPEFTFEDRDGTPIITRPSSN